MSTFKMHPLHTEQMHLDQMKHRGVHGYHEFVAEGRCTGRSTAQALAYLSRAIETPNKWVDVEDHANISQGLSGRRIQRIDVELAVLVARMADKLGLDHIHVQGSRVIFERRVVPAEPETASVPPVPAPEFPTNLPSLSDSDIIRGLMRKNGWQSAYTAVGSKTAEGNDRIVFFKTPMPS